MSQLRPIYRRDLWWQLLPYIHEPASKNNRNRLRAIQLKRLIKSTKTKERSTKRTSSASRRLRSLTYKNTVRLETLGGDSRLLHAPSRNDFTMQRSKDFKHLVETYFVIRTFLRLHAFGDEHNAWPSIQKSIAVLSGNEVPSSYKESLDSDIYSLFQLTRKSKNPLNESWSRFKNSAPLVFGMFEAIRIDLASENLYPPTKSKNHSKNEKEFIKSLDRVCAKRIYEILTFALFAQDALTNVTIRNTKKPSLDPSEILWLPKIQGLVASQSTFEPLTKVEIAAFHQAR